MKENGLYICHAKIKSHFPMCKAVYLKKVRLSLLEAGLNRRLIYIYIYIDDFLFVVWGFLIEKCSFGDEEWYFFTPRDRKYPNGMRPNRMAGSGYWKATGIDKPIVASCGSKVIGVKKALVFYTGKPPKGNKTDWTMHEYRLPEPAAPAADSSWTTSTTKQNSMRVSFFLFLINHLLLLPVRYISSLRCIYIYIYINDQEKSMYISHFNSNGIDKKNQF